MNTKINKWYDALPEPRRFLIFFIPIALSIAGAVNATNDAIQVISVVTLIVLFSGRVLYFYNQRLNQN